MKKILFVLFFTTISVMVFGQDIIITKDARRIEAQITEVNANNVKYKRFGSPDSPVYTILKSEISSITYQDGAIEVFKEKVQNTQPQTQTTNFVQDDFLKMSDIQQERFLRDNYPDLYRKFHSGMSLGSVGKGFSTSGWILTGVGIGGIIVGAVADVDEVVLLSLLSVTLGQTFVITSIPLRAIGGAQKKAVQNYYKRNYMGQAQSQGNFQVNFYPNAVGLAYVF